MNDIRDATYLVGIDLGTSNCAVAYAALAEGAAAEVRDFPVPQLRGLGDVAPLGLVPSCIYLPGEGELPAEGLRLPWGESPEQIVGAYARTQGSKVPGRLVSSAKSWLCHPGVDRTAPILPWGAPNEARRLSPVGASAALIEHMRRAWDHAHPEAPMSQQEVVLTVPASFDEVARALTVSAARSAGLEKFTLLEEPQAAFYDFTARYRTGLEQVLRDTRLVLVVDVGGGTTDFTLVQIAVNPEGVGMRRLAVGEHLMLGGDNMDAALGRLAEERLLARGRRFSTTQWNQLVQASRAAKEAMLGGSPPAQMTLAVAAEGSRLIGGSMTTHLTREEAERAIVEGFFPACSPTDAPQKSSRTALQEFGLPYAQDAAITRHLAAFLRLHAEAGFGALGEPFVPGALPRPDAMLLNGGVFNSQRLAARLREVVSGWWPEARPIQLLDHASLDLAVARGAAYYGLVRRGLGRRIGGGSAHAFYIGLDRKGQEKPAALCVVPRGHEEGEALEVKNQVFQLTLNRPVQFPLYTATSDRLERPGDIIEVGEELTALPPLHAVLHSSGKKTGTAPVHLRAVLTEIGTLELWCVANESKERWRLEFELRGTATGEQAAVVESMPPRFADAAACVQHVFGTKPPQGAFQPGLFPKDVKQLWPVLEQILGARDTWRVPVLRELWGVLMAGASRRRRSADHERIFAQLFGYTLRPGFGYPLDEWRCEQAAALFAQGVQFHKEKPVWVEFWVLWRRIAGGLSEARQIEIYEFLKPHLQRLSASEAKGVRTRGIQPQGLNEMVRLAAGLEHLPATEKTSLGAWVATRLREPGGSGGPWAWALGRLGTRQPLYGSIHTVVPPSQAEEWINLLLDPAQANAEGMLFAVAQLARLTGDRSRDVSESHRARALELMRSRKAPASWQRMLSEVIALESADQARALGDTLPVGLRLG